MQKRTGPVRSDQTVANICPRYSVTEWLEHWCWGRYVSKNLASSTTAQRPPLAASSVRRSFFWADASTSSERAEDNHEDRVSDLTSPGFDVTQLNARTKHKTIASCGLCSGIPSGLASEAVGCMVHGCPRWWLSSVMRCETARVEDSDEIIVKQRLNRQRVLVVVF